MLVFWEQRLAFLATPKTGTTAIESALESLAALSIQRPPILKHTTVMRYHRFIAPYLEVSSGQEFDVVALMREPRSWLSSWYRYRQRDDITDPRRSTQGITFDEFVRAYCAEEPPEFAAIGSQAQFFKPRNGKGLTRLFRYEAIDSFVDFLEDRLGCEITLPRVNVSPDGDTDLSAATEDLLRRHLKADFEIYASIRD